jgi:hypothetical protein
MAYSNDQSRAAPQMAKAVTLFLSAFADASEDLRRDRGRKRRLSCAETLSVRGDDPEADIAAKFIRDAEADLAIAEQRLGFGPSVWERLERLPTEYDARQMQALYRTFSRMVAADLTWFASAAEWFFGADVTPAKVGPQVAVGVEEIARETRRTTAGVLRLIQGGKLPVATVNGETISTQGMLRRHRRYGETAIAA